jgi:hypothetical protein
MRNLCSRSALTALIAVGTFFGTDLALADAPAWVPEQYRHFFFRFVDERSAWERALSYLDVSVGETGPSFALVAGVSTYPKMSGHENLAPAKLDVEKMVAYLSSEPESFNEIVVLLDQDVTAENLRYFLTEYFPRRLSETKHARFLFAYSGHGITAPNGRGYLLTSQAAGFDQPHAGTISLAELRTQFQEIVDTVEKGRHRVLALINACYGVDFHRLTLAFGQEDETAAPLPTREGAHAITAGGSGERTWQDDRFGQGDGPKGSIFFEAVLAGLDGRADKLPQDGIVTVGELETYLKTTISRFTDERQNPSGDDLMSTRSPGGFFFLDRDWQVEKANAKPLEGEWWGGISFGMPDSVPATDVLGNATSPIVEDAGFSNAAAPNQAAQGREIEAPSTILEPPGSEQSVSPEAPVQTFSPLAKWEDTAKDVNAKIGPSELAGYWSGEAEEPGGFRFTVELEVTSNCAINRSCGTITVPHVPCSGRITLIDSRSEEFEFSVDQFDSASAEACKPGAGEVFKPRADGTLEYTATYSGAHGLLRRSVAPSAGP